MTNYLTSDDVSQNMIKLFKSNGKLYGLPDILKKAGYKTSFSYGILRFIN